VLEHGEQQSHLFLQGQRRHAEGSASQ
jgi:hypothetical protein